MPHIFPFAEFWWFYPVFAVFIGIAIYGSIRIFHRDTHAISISQATHSALSWFILALIFDLFLYFFSLWRLSKQPEAALAQGLSPHHVSYSLALEFLSGYLVEKALAVDNLFVFIVIFRFFSIPKELQHRVLFYGLFGAIVLRGIFIAVGSVVMTFHLVMVIFGLFLIYQGVSVLLKPDGEMDPAKNPVLRILRKYLPVSTDTDGEKFFTAQNGKRLVTPLFVALVFIEVTDIMFAFDSVPAIFGLTREPLVVFTSNIFAVIDLRALYFLLAAFIHKFHYLSVGLSFVLIFIGSKMAILDSHFNGKFPTVWSLAIVVVLVTGSMLFSIMRPASPASDEVKKER